MGSMAMKLIIAGSRTITDYNFIKMKLDGFREHLIALEPWTVIREVVSGGAKGIDLAGEQWATENGLLVKRFPAQWTTFGRSAGVKRNLEMAHYADAALIIWDGKSKGSAHMVTTAKQLKLKSWECIV